MWRTASAGEAHRCNLRQTPRAPGLCRGVAVLRDLARPRKRPARRAWWSARRAAPRAMVVGRSSGVTAEIKQEQQRVAVGVVVVDG